MINYGVVQRQMQATKDAVEKEISFFKNAGKKARKLRRFPHMNLPFAVAHEIKLFALDTGCSKVLISSMIPKSLVTAF